MLLLAGCATAPMPAPMPAPIPAPLPEKKCDFTVGGKCKQNTASDISGATSLGHSNDEIKP